MKYLKQFTIILAISLLGELLNHFLALPIPGSIYGIVILFILLSTKVIKVDQIKDTASFLIEIMPVMFIPAAVGIINVWDIVKDNIITYSILIVVSTILVMGVSGLVTQLLIRKGDKQ